MPLYENNLVIEIARGIKAFLNLRVGITRGSVQGLDAPVQPQQPDQANPQMQRQIKRQRQQIEQNKKQISQRDDRINQLKKRLAKRGATREFDNVTHDGVLLPPRNQRPCGANFQDDGFYLGSARKEADMLAESMGLSSESRLLDVGSGPGRLAIGIRDRIGDIRRYCGVDVDENSARWGWQYITCKHPNFQFLHIDVENTRYNPEGAQSDGDFAFPFGDGEFDIITLYSVFTHMLTDGVWAYLKEFQRILTPDGRIYLTAFLEDDVPDVEENPEGYLGREWKGALHCVRYEREFFEGLLDEAGFKLDGFDLGRGRGGTDFGIVKERGQSGVYLSRRL